MASINPYLTFQGNCLEAFKFYQKVFGGEFSHMSKFKDVPSDQHHMGDVDGELLMHISLPLGDTILMGSDKPEKFGPVIKGSNFSISINTGSEEETKRIFNALSEGGTVTMPLDKTFWNAYFGMCTDKFGVHWMVNFEYGN